MVDLQNHGRVVKIYYHDNDKELLLIRLHGVRRGINGLTADKD